MRNPTISVFEHFETLAKGYLPRRLTAGTLLFALIAPIFLLSPVQKAAATSAPLNIRPTFPSAPPEPFHVGDSLPVLKDLMPMAASYGAAILGFFAPSESAVASGSSKRPALRVKDVAALRDFYSAPSTPADPALMPTAAGPVNFDFDGDGKADISRWHPATKEFKVKRSTDGSFLTEVIGSTSAKVSPGRFNADIYTDIAVYDAGTWTIKSGVNGADLPTITFGQAGDVPVPADYDGDGITDAAFIRPSSNTWWVRQSTNGSVIPYSAGGAGDIPVPGNYDGDAKADIAVYRPSTGVWTISNSNGGTSTYTWGTGSDIPVPADYDGDGKTDVAVYRRTTGTWYVIGSQAGMFSQVWGNYGDQPVPADYDGDNKADFSVWRPTTGTWHTIKSSTLGFDAQQLGVAGDTAVPSAYIKQIGGTVSSYGLAQSRLSPKNATGGTDLYSQNFSWGTSLVNLPGRAGMNAGFGMSYNSLVWTKSGNEVHFDADTGNVSPGFRLGFPTIEPAYYDQKTSRFAYLMVTPSGGRVEFRQVGAGNVYETADSSYVQLKTTGAANPNDPVEAIGITLTGTDGTQMTYEWKGGAFHCKEIKDRNGNYITITHNVYGYLQTVTDTLGRVITVNYDSADYPISVTQTWKDGNGAGLDVLRTWATFSYTTKTISTDFDGSLSVIGPPNGTVLKVLQKVTYPDLSSTQFDYNDYGQVYKVRNVAADSPSHVLNYVRTNLESPNLNQFDCPRFTETRSWVENFNGGNETVVNNVITPNTNYSLPGGLSGTGAMVDVWMTGHPNSAISKTYVAESGWKEGMPLATENLADGQVKRWTWTNYTQDDTNLAYTLNPRVVESRVGDSVNVKKTAVTYRLLPNTTVSEYGLVSKVEVFDSGLSNVIQHVETDYNLSSVYTDKRIIGLPLETRASGKNDVTQNLEQVSRVTYGYDEGSFGDAALSQNISPVQHDNTNYGSLFITGRGNVTSTTRHDVLGQTAATTSSVKYNTAGAPVSQISPGSTTGTTREIRIGYADVFNSTGNPATYAYPTTLTDPANNSSTVKYRYDIGANVWAKSPDLNAQTPGKQTEKEYDFLGRLLKDKTVNHGGAYTRYEYPTNGIQSKVFSTIIDMNNSITGDTADEVLSESWADGAGRTRMSRTELPGSVGGYSGTVVEYNILGQVKRQSVSTEINASWNFPAATLWNLKEYDWKGRVTKATNTDGTFSEAFYEGCGCAGGEIVRVEGEQLADGKRKQKIYSDILGRQYKSEVLNWDGSIYATTITKFNGRDQTLWVKQFDGAAPSDALTSDSCPIQPTSEPQSCQMTKLSYDGHARLKTQHTPKQDDETSTIYNYYQNDEVQQIKDARGATTNFTYNNRGLATNVVYSMPTVADPPDSFRPNNSPIGHFDTVDTINWLAKGWSFDPNNSSVSSSVHFYIDGPAGQGTYIGQAVADKPRPDVNTIYNISGSHGFEFAIPSQYINGAQHTIYAYGIDTGADGNAVLSGSPKTFSYNPESVPPQLNSSVSFDYDALGNRLWMTDNFGRTDYEYDSLSRLKSETRQINDTMPNGSALVMANAPLPNNSFKLQYAYGLSGQLTSLTDPYGAVVNYGYDQAGRLDNVTGTTFGGVTSYANNAKYEAWGALKELTYGSSLQATMTYNNRLQPATYNLSGGTGGPAMNKNYEYYADGALRYSQDLTDAKFDRLQTYDHLGRIKEGKTGLEARSTSTVPAAEQSTSLPYRQSYEFNAFNNMKQRNNLHWGVESWYGQNNNLSYTYKNNRIQGMGWLYDADGRNLQTAQPDDYASSTYNAAGQMVRSVTGESDAIRGYDGGGREAKRLTANLVQTETSAYWDLQPVKYYVRSSVLGGETVSEVWANGRKGKTFVRAAGAQLAYQSAYSGPTAALNEAVFFEYSDASGMSQRTTDKTGAAVAYGDGGEGSPVEADPFGSNAGTSTPYMELSGGGYEPSPQYPMLQSYFEDSPNYVNGVRQTCSLDGFAIGCSRAMEMLDHGSALPAGLAQYQNQPGFQFNSNGLGIYSVTIPRQVGWNVTYGPNDGPNGTARPVYNGTSTFSFSLPFTNISWSPPQQVQSQVKMTSEEVQRLWQGVDATVIGKCADFIKRLAEAVTGKEIYDAKLWLAEGFSRPVIGKAGTTSGVYWGDADRAHNPWSDFPAIEIGRYKGSIPRANRHEFSQWFDSRGNYLPPIVGVIHEIIHVAARADDQVLARVVQEMGIAVFAADGKTTVDPPKPGEYGGKYWGAALKNRCDETATYYRAKRR